MWGGVQGKVWGPRVRIFHTQPLVGVFCLYTSYPPGKGLGACYVTSLSLGSSVVSVKCIWYGAQLPTTFGCSCRCVTVETNKLRDLWSHWIEFDLHLPRSMFIWRCMVGARVETSCAPLISLPSKHLCGLYFPASFRKSWSWNILADIMWPYQAKIFICQCEIPQLSLSWQWEPRRLYVSDCPAARWLSPCQPPRAKRPSPSHSWCTLNKNKN